MKYNCENCDWGTDDPGMDCDPVYDVLERFEEGDTFTPFQCPTCGALVFRSTSHPGVSEKAIHNIRERLAEMKIESLDFKEMWSILKDRFIVDAFELTWEELVEEFLNYGSEEELESIKKG